MGLYQLLQLLLHARQVNIAFVCYMDAARVPGAIADAVSLGGGVCSSAVMASGCMCHHARHARNLRATKIQLQRLAKAVVLLDREPFRNDGKATAPRCV